mgnify:CR=1 FL=1|jgi:hypothetical protein|tara:strand:- start:4275 stop:4499 length:225 start_codon:yes stop_codon:yes gene_type:complete
MTQDPETFLMDWSTFFIVGGGVCALTAFSVGLIILRDARKLAKRIEGNNRKALSEYEKINEEVLKIRSELSSDQ